MSHNIHINQFGRASFVSARIKAWHGLGQIVDGAMTSEEALEQAGLNYTVGIEPALVRVPTEDGAELKEVPNTFITYRTDTNQPFSAVGKKYTVVQNCEAFDFFDGIVGKGEAIYETAGALGNGEIVFITAKLPNTVNVPGELIEKYLLLRTSHDGNEPIVGGFTPVRVVCNNTLNFALREGLQHQVRIRHTASAHEKLNKAMELMGLANDLSERLAVQWTSMKKKKVDDLRVQRLFKELVMTPEELEETVDISARKENMLNDMWKFYLTGVGQKDIIGTAFGAYNAVSGYFQNAKATSSPEALLKSNLFGENARKVSQAMEMIMID